MKSKIFDNYNEGLEMEERIKKIEKGKEALKALNGLGLYLKKSSIEESLLNLIDFRVSQINGCAFCLDIGFYIFRKDRIVPDSFQWRGIWDYRGGSTV